MPPRWRTFIFSHEREDDFRIRKGRRRGMQPGYAGIRPDFWSRVLRHAQRRGIEVQLTAREAWSVYIDQGGVCVLTGSPIWFGPRDGVGEVKWLAAVFRRLGTHPAAFDPDEALRIGKENWITASLDRIDSRGPYDISNVQWIHKTLQGMKMGLGQDEFLFWCRRVASHTTPRGRPTP